MNKRFNHMSQRSLEALAKKKVYSKGGLQSLKSCVHSLASKHNNNVFKSNSP